MPGARVSICTTNYNCGHALHAHLTSIYSQFSEGEFEYVCVDNYSRDASHEILDTWQSRHGNFRWIRRRCSMGWGRELAAQATSAQHILIVDTDTVYYPVLRDFVNRVLMDMPDVAVQAIYAGIFPRSLWAEVGGRRDLNVGEDFDMWMRIWALGRMRWYPVRMGENLKEPSARDSQDYLSERYSEGERLLRYYRGQIDKLKLVRYRDLDLDRIWRSNTIDLGLGDVQASWFSNRARRGVFARMQSSAMTALRILES